MLDMLLDQIFACKGSFGSCLVRASIDVVLVEVIDREDGIAAERAAHSI